MRITQKVVVQNDTRASGRRTGSNWRSLTTWLLGWLPMPVSGTGRQPPYLGLPDSGTLTGDRRR